MIASATVEVNRRLSALPKGYPVNNTCEGARVDVMQLLIRGHDGGLPQLRMSFGAACPWRYTMQPYALQQQSRGLETPDLISFSFASEAIAAVLRALARASCRTPHFYFFLSLGPA